MAITISGVRFSYTHLFQPQAPVEPNGTPKYSTVILIPKSNTAAKAAVDQAIAQAIEYGVQAKWGGVRPPQPAVPIHDGDLPKADGTAFGEECKGMWVLKASSVNPPFVVDAQVQPIIDPTQVYSGMWGNVSVNLSPYLYAGKKGIGCYLNGVQKTRDDEALGGERVTAQSAFTAVPTEATATQAWGAPAPQAWG